MFLEGKNFVVQKRIVRGVFFMDIEFDLGEYKFVWDSEKAKINKKKHKVSFETAARVFLDKCRYDEFDESHSIFEERVKTVGRVGKILSVIYTERGERNRIISARPANKEEEEEYYGQFNFF